MIQSRLQNCPTCPNFDRMWATISRNLNRRGSLKEGKGGRRGSRGEPHLDNSWLACGEACRIEERFPHYRTKTLGILRATSFLLHPKGNRDHHRPSQARKLKQQGRRPSPIDPELKPPTPALLTELCLARLRRRCCFSARAQGALPIVFRPPCTLSSCFGQRLICTTAAVLRRRRLGMVNSGMMRHSSRR